MEKRNYESECESDLEKDDSEILAKRYEKFMKTNNGVHKKSSNGKTNHFRVKSHWTRIYDSIQEHFSSHVNINCTSHLLPPNIYALKQSAKQGWLLLKKRECERRKRLRLKIEAEREKEKLGEEPSNILLSLVDSCESCKKLYVTVNLFWGVTLCDFCYFNSEVVSEIMRNKVSVMESPFQVSKRRVTPMSSSSGENKSEMRYKSMVEKYFTVPDSGASSEGEDEEEDSNSNSVDGAFALVPASSSSLTKRKKRFSPPRRRSPTPPPQTPEIIEEEEDEDIRTVSTYVPPSQLALHQPTTTLSQTNENSSCVVDDLLPYFSELSTDDEDHRREAYSNKVKEYGRRDGGSDYENDLLFND